MFERFTEKAIKVIMLAQEEARRLGHNFVGTELADNVSYAKIAQACGLNGVQIFSMNELKDKLTEVGIIFCSISEAVQKHPELVK